MSDWKPENLTWAALLAHWIDMAKVSVSFPKTDEGAAWRNSVAPVIDLQAVTFALAELDRLHESEHRLALDRAEMIISRAEEALGRAWASKSAVPENLGEVVSDARRALGAARLVVDPDAGHS